MHRIQPGRLLDLRHRRVGQAQLPHRAVDVPAAPACILQSAGQMLADAAAGCAFFCHQNDGVGRKLLHQLLPEREDADQLIHIAGDALLRQQLCGGKSILHLVRIAHQYGLRTRQRDELVVLPARAAVSGQDLALAATGVADGPRPLHLMPQQNRQPVPQLLIIRGRIDGHSDLTEEGRVVDALVRLTVSGDETCTVHREDDIFMQKVDVMDDLVVGSDEFYSITVQADKTQDSQGIADQIVHLLEKRHQCAGEDYFQVESFQDIMKSMNEMLGMVTTFISFVAGISLLVGGIGVMNIMLVSVTERTREIGIRKSLGAKTASIMLQFLAEAAILTVIGGLIGILLGVLAAYGICTVMSNSMGMAISPGISPTVVLAATLFSCAVGVFFGIYPARKAAKLSPIEALRRN